MSRHPKRTEAALRRSVDAAPWLTDMDDAAVQMMIDLTEQMDLLATPTRQASLLASDQVAENAGRTAYLAGVLRPYLNDAGLSPKGRADLGLEADESDDALAEAIRAAFSE